MRINSEMSVGLFVLGALAAFFYMTFKIGAFRVDTALYRKHTVYFNDLSGLSRKADVKISGVKVGWVFDVGLVKGDDSYSAKADIMVHKKYKLHSDSHAVVRQDGLLGVKYLEVSPGDPLAPILTDGQQLSSKGKSPVSVDDLLRQFKIVGENIEVATATIRDSISSVDGKSQLKETFENIHKAAEKVAMFAESIDRIISHNEDDINGIIKDIKEFAKEIREEMPNLAQDLRRVATKLEVDTLPSFQRNFERIANVFDRDFDKVSSKLDVTADAIGEAAVQARDGLRSMGSVADKINDGKGILGKLVNEDETYQDLKVAIQGLKNYFSKMESVSIVFDSHFENMYNPAENFDLRDSKGYFDIRIHPGYDHFYLVQMMGSLKGSIERTITDRKWFDSNNNEMDPDLLGIDKNYKLSYAARQEEIVRKRDAIKYGFQFGKIFQDIAFRFGLFENSFGLGVDYDIPFDNDKLRWVTSVEAFDFRGRDRLDDQRPHLKWINKVFFLRNFYFNFGADDFISKDNANTFFGLGLRFADDDMKYFISKFSSSK